MNLRLLTFDSIFLTVSKQFEIKPVRGVSSEETWLTRLDAVLKARNDQDPNDVTPAIWKDFLVFAFILVPCVQSW